MHLLNFLYKYLDDNDEIYPIVSSGLHGNQKYNNGTGFNVFYNSSRTITAIVQTNETQYTVNFKLDNVTDGTIRSFVMTWDKDVGLKLYMDAVVVGESQGTVIPETANAIAVSDQEYLLLFAQYHFQFSYLVATFMKFTTWRKPLSATEITAMILGKAF